MSIKTKLEDGVAENTVNVLKDMAQAVNDKKLGNILDDLVGIIEALIQFDGSRKIMGFYVEFALKHTDEINNCDENYITSSECILAKISTDAHLKFLEIWNKITDEDKSYVWETLQENLKLTEKYHNL